MLQYWNLNMVDRKIDKMPDLSPTIDTYPTPSWLTALGRGALMRCPVCGKISAFDGFLKVKNHCPHCKYPLRKIHCDDVPPYIAMTLGLLLGVIGIVASDKNGSLDFGLALGVFLPLVTLVSVGTLRPIKGIVLVAMIKNKIK